MVSGSREWGAALRVLKWVAPAVIAIEVLLVALVVALYTVVWLFGFFSGVHTRPHYVDADRLVLRTGHLAAVSVDTTAIRAVRRANHGGYKGMVSVVDGAIPALRGQGAD
ncbi:hypothetical protein ACOBQX_18140 [Actinokineospora sp. G85]|uniref:hypothetical protein n=1 Tax=Actinokineospora sp. G85 TaxID=3406626 RepID=UPI003C75722A